MKVSIITVCYNSQQTVEQTILSVSKQAYKDIEHIVIDGGSSDGTLDIVKRYSNIELISEKDDGLYDAMNKGVKLASGEIVGILNSDDLFYDEDVVGNVVKEFERSGADAVYGDLVYVEKDDTDKVVRYWRSSDHHKGDFVKGWHPPHPAFFVKRHVYEKCGLFDTSFELSADFELMLRFIEKHRIKLSRVPKTLVKMRLGGETNKSLRNIIKGNMNCLRAFKKNGILLNPLYPLFRLLPKFWQYFSAAAHFGGK